MAMTTVGAQDERLAFNFGVGTVPGQGHQADIVPTFATAAYAEPRDWGYGGLLAFTAVLLLRPQDQIPALRVLHLAEICALIGIGPMFMHRFARRAPVFRITPETVGLAILGAVMLATAPFSIWPSDALMTIFDSYLKIVIVFVLMMNTLTTAKRIEQVTSLIVLCCGYIAFRAAFDYARGVNLVDGGRVAGAVSGIFGNPNDLALNMVTFMPAAMMFAFSRQQPAWRRLLAAGIAALMLATVIFTKSRGGALGLGVMLVTFLYLGRRLRPGFMIMALASVLLAVPFMPTSFWNRMATIADEKQDKAEFTGSSEARRVVMEEGIATFFERPLVGVGVGQFKNYNPPERKERWRETHNALIQVAAETGVFGLAAFVFLLYRAIRSVVQTLRILRPARRGRPDPLRTAMSAGDRASLYAGTTALAAGLAGWFTCSLFASVAYSWTFYYVLALIVATHELVRLRLTPGKELHAA
ncbi:MAG TPA: O-antigen ligase family protein [Vicinamibacterales bacterium]|jgi:O-antigen ligase